jgi:hypothetical protein
LIPQLKRNPFDIAQTSAVPCPFYLPVHQYLNTEASIASLGVPLNFTYGSNVITALYGFADIGPSTPLSASTGDPMRQNGLPSIEYLLSTGVKVAFVFGDRDFRCPWTGGELTALAADWTYKDEFAAAGYEEMQGIVTPREQGGLPALVKQAGRFSFSRILDAGHSTIAYAPETVHKIFERTLNGVDIVSGMEMVADGYTTYGPASSLGWRNELPESVPATCIVEGQFQDWNPWDALG